MSFNNIKIFIDKLRFKRYFASQAHITQLLNQMRERNETVRWLEVEKRGITEEWKRAIDLQIATEKKLQTLEKAVLKIDEREEDQGC